MTGCRCVECAVDVPNAAEHQRRIIELAKQAPKPQQPRPNEPPKGR